MLMLAHTYLLQNVLREAGIKKYDLDIFVYNIAPDLLTIHADITSRQTHNIKRSFDFFPNYPKAAFVMFHLLVDDLAHYGSVCFNVPDKFNSNSQGYAYRRGKQIVGSILNFHNQINQKISSDEAFYQSHLIIEMIYDLVIFNKITNFQSMTLLSEAICLTVDKYINEFAETINYLYGFAEDDIMDVMRKATVYLTADRMQKIMNLDGRVQLYASKFGLLDGNKMLFDDIKSIFLQALKILENDEIFQQETDQAIIKYGWLSSIMPLS